MNPPSTGLWNDPPPPGIEDERDHCMEKIERQAATEPKTVDPFVKSPPYVDYENHKQHRDKHSHRRRSRSRSHDRHRSRTRSRDRKHHSRSKRHRRSRSQSARGHYKHRSRSISYSRSPSHERSRRHKDKSVSGDLIRGDIPDQGVAVIPGTNDFSDNEPNKDEDKFEEEEAEAVNQNAFKNDGSFLELFRKMQEEQQQKVEAAKAEASASEIKVPAFGKRRGGRVLKTGVVMKTKADEESEGIEPQDPWSIYLKEVKRYKEACCDDDSKTRPLVK
ncbi:telomerase rna component interacting rnase [Holotrichia oblita]|uniref:Telomerase rna component interacting rnase n=1 Tax=Holotrichia oblita TaxID=644536 RepID=A0ACB9TXL3_HOLOL|nr:telomerase rna component interacting rnase [Holotrichia oblita]